MTPSRCVILDVDGVIRRGRELLPGADAAIDAIRASGLRVGILSNNSMRGPASLHGELSRLGVRIEPNEVMSSARAAALWLARERPDASVHVCGTGELEDELRVAGVRVVAADRCDVVLVGMNPELRYRDLADALEPLLRGALFVICNRDPNYPVEDGRRVPGSGAVVGALEAASERRADVVIGKPSSIALAELCTSLDVDPGACIVVGDSITSDIEMARRMGLPSILITPEEAAPPDGATMRTALSLGDAVSIVLELAGDGAPPARPGPAT